MTEHVSQRIDFQKIKDTISTVKDRPFVKTLRVVGSAVAAVVLANVSSLLWTDYVTQRDLAYQNFNQAKASVYDYLATAETGSLVDPKIINNFYRAREQLNDTVDWGSLKMVGLIGTASGAVGLGMETVTSLKRARV